MKKIDLKNILYKKEQSALEFNFDNLVAPSMYNFITFDDINQLYNIAKSIRLSSKIKEKYQMIDSIMKAKGFRKVGGGTNRVVYMHYEYSKAVLKIAVDRVGLKDNPAEFKNQHLLKPFVSKMFECSPCGTIAWVEYVYPITNREEFLSVADDIFTLITKKIVGKYVLEDIGTKYFMNWGMRENLGPVLLDYPYIYQLDGAKLYCNNLILDTNIVCDGMIDYDDGFNELVCIKCGRKYLATDLEDKSNNIKVIIEKDEEEIPMKVVLKQGDNILKTYDSKSTSTINIDDSTDVIGVKLRTNVKMADKKIPKRMKTVDLEKEEKNKAKGAVKKAEKVAQNLQDHFHAVNDGRFIEPDYSSYELKNEDTKQEEQINNVPEIDYEKEFGLTPIDQKETLNKKSGPNPYEDMM